jgi:hypothetical protein
MVKKKTTFNQDNSLVSTFTLCIRLFVVYAKFLVFVFVKIETTCWKPTNKSSVIWIGKKIQKTFFHSLRSRSRFRIRTLNEINFGSKQKFLTCKYLRYIAFSLIARKVLCHFTDSQENFFIYCISKKIRQRIRPK